jgi:hypothetical protein
MTLIKTYIYKDLSSISVVNLGDNRANCRFYSFIQKKSGSKALGQKNAILVDEAGFEQNRLILGLFHPFVHQS